MSCEEGKDFTIIILLLCICFMLMTFEPMDDIFKEEITSMSKIMKTAEYIAKARNYSTEKYNCVDFSRDLAKAYEKQRVNAEVCIGNYTHENKTVEPHAWVKVYVPVPVEATNGEMVTVYDFNKYYQEKKCKPWDDWRYPKHD